MTGELSRRGRGRRRVVGATIFGPLIVSWPGVAWAGTQAEEPLADAVRTAVINRQGVMVANIEGNQYTAAQLGDLVGTALKQ